MVRTFIGVTIPEDIKRYVIGIQEQVKTLPIKARFVEPKNLHISLSFLGDIQGSAIESTKYALDDITSSYKKFEVNIERLLLIPNEKFVRVIALGVRSDVLETIRKDVVKKIGGESHPVHLTLARINTIINRHQFSEGINKIIFNETIMQVDAICLIESKLQKTGPIYTIFHKTYLK